MTEIATNKASASLLDASLLWQQLSERIDALSAAWEAVGAGGTPPNLADFLPSEPGPLRWLALVETIKVDLEHRWQEGRFPKRIEEYVTEFPELIANGSPPCDLIYEEFHIRKQIGDAVTPEEYCRRFPERSGELKRLMNLEQPHHSTVMVSKERVPTFEAGQKLDDFELVRPLGKGAFASVFLARQVSMQRLVALKISADRGFEPQTLAQMEHPHIVRVFDQRQLSESKLRLLYMQYVPGGTLLEVIDYVRRLSPHERNGAALLAAIDKVLIKAGEQPPTDSLTRHRLKSLTWPQAVCWLGARLAAALDYAHERGVLHRDVKPANVLVAADGHPKLADFNISFSKIDGATPAAYFGGSLAYMSPEQLEAFDPAHSRQPDELDQRSDVYALGVLLWELLTLMRPFIDNALATHWSEQLGKMVAGRKVGVSPETRLVATHLAGPMTVNTLLKCLEPQPENRYASARELARELDLCLQPRAQQLLRGERSLGSILKKHPVTSTIVIGLLPNILLSILNIIYNKIEILDKLGPDDRRLFTIQVATVNTIAYSVGLGYLGLIGGKMLQVVARLAGKRAASQGEVLDSGLLDRRALSLGTQVALVSAVLWSVSGLVFPLWLQFSQGEDSQLNGNHYAHFIVSNLLCGMIAATQTYFVATFCALRFCFPWLLELKSIGFRDTSQLADLARRGRFVFALAVMVPLLALPAVVLINFDQAIIGGLGVLGLIGCGLAYVLEQSIRNDATALAAALQPASDPLMDSGTLEPFTASTRRK